MGVWGLPGEGETPSPPPTLRGRGPSHGAPGLGWGRLTHEHGLKNTPAHRRRPRTGRPRPGRSGTRLWPRAQGRPADPARAPRARCLPTPWPGPPTRAEPRVALPPGETETRAGPPSVRAAPASLLRRSADRRPTGSVALGLGPPRSAHLLLAARAAARWSPRPSARLSAPGSGGREGRAVGLGPAGPGRSRQEEPERQVGTWTPRERGRGRDADAPPTSPTAPPPAPDPAPTGAPRGGSPTPIPQPPTLTAPLELSASGRGREPLLREDTQGEALRPSRGCRAAPQPA